MPQAASSQQLHEKIAKKNAVVAIVGLGYVGLPLAVEAAKAGFLIRGIENNPQRCKWINEGHNYIQDVRSGELSDLVSRSRVSARTDFTPVSEADIVIICVPTPLNKNKEPDISYIVNSADEIARHIRKGTLVVLESTTYPGTTEEVIRPRIEKTGLKLGADFFLAFSPERVDPGNRRFNTANTSKIVGGADPSSQELAMRFYQSFVTNVIAVSSPRVSEMVKVFENIYRSVNIALVNELAVLCEKMDIDVYEVIKAADTKPYGFQAFWPGPGVGGHCIPLDPYYLAWKGKEYDMHARFIELAGEINEGMPRVVLGKVAGILNQMSKPVRGSKIVQLGIAYKKDIDDVRESPALKVYELLVGAGAQVQVCDPHVGEFWVREHDFTYGNAGPSVKTCALSPALLAAADLVVLTTDHAAFDYAAVLEHSRCIFDTRNAFGFRGMTSPRIVKLSSSLKRSELSRP